MSATANVTVGPAADDQAAQPSGGFSQETIIVMSYLSLFSVMGTIGNLLVLYVFSKMLKQNLTSTIFILTLAGTDFATCLVTLPFTIVMEYLDFQVQYQVPCKIYGFILSYTVMYSSLIMVAIAFDRYLCICHPFLHAMNMRRARITVIVLASLTFAFSLILSASSSVYRYMETNTDIYDGNATKILTNGSFEFYGNATLAPVPTSTYQYSGQCSADKTVLGIDVYMAVKYVHNSFFVLAIVVAFVLYSLIMRRVLSRTKNRRHFSIKCPCFSAKEHDETQLAPMNGESGMSQDQNNGNGGGETVKVNPTPPKCLQRRGSKKTDKNLIANLKIAGTLFVVTIVFFVTFFPAWLMVTGFIAYDIILFNIYFLYNVANPIIYAFMNQNFRAHLKELFSCKKRYNRAATSRTESSVIR